MRVCGECKWLEVSAETEGSQDRRKYYTEHPEKLYPDPEALVAAQPWRVPGEYEKRMYEHGQRYLLPHYACTAPVPASAAVELVDDMAMDSPADDCPCFTKREA